MTLLLTDWAPEDVNKPEFLSGIFCTPPQTPVHRADCILTVGLERMIPLDHWSPPSEDTLWLKLGNSVLQVVKQCPPQPARRISHWRPRRGSQRLQITGERPAAANACSKSWANESVSPQSVVSIPCMHPPCEIASMHLAASFPSALHGFLQVELSSCDQISLKS